MHEGAMERALAAWRRAIGEDNVLTDEDADRAYGGSATPLFRRSAALKVSSIDDLSEIVRIASEFAVPLYPISTGRNWGYGGASPVRDGCVIVDLAGFDRILDFDAELGLVTIQPGVTQQKLRAYLDTHAPEFLVPVHGGGPNCSLLGNAIERGYGITPIADHFGAVTTIEAILPDGTIYRSALDALGGETVDKAFKWGIGPYLDGLFTQSNFGIVTKATIALARTPERTEAFFFWIERDADLERAVAAVRDVVRTAGGVIESINLMNTRRVLSMMVPYPRDQVPHGSIIPDELVANLARENKAPAWMGVGAMYGNAKLVKATRKVIKGKLRPIAHRLVFTSPSFVRRLRRVLEWLRWRSVERLERVVGTIDKSLELMSGTPSEIALPLAYWKSDTPPPDGQPMNPARDDCGLIWYSPLVPMKPDAVRRYVQMVTQTCIAHGIEPLITLTSLSERCLDSTVPILFDRADSDDLTRAHLCYEALFRGGQKMGCIPYRVGIKHMELVVDPAAPAWQLSAKIKDAIDPQGIMSPGRYSSV